MVHLDKVEGQRGSMILHEDGSIISSSGSLASSEKTSSTFMSLLNNSLQMDFNVNQRPQQNGHAGGGDNGGTGGGGSTGAEASQPVFKWNRVTVSFGDHSYVACLSNKRIHIVDRESTPAEENAVVGELSNNANE